MKNTFIFFLLFSCGTAFLCAATPPGLINYQGVLRDDAGAPLDGSYDMVFTFYSDATAGDEIVIDSHLAAGSGAITVADGLFNVALGSGTVTDGSGTGTYTSLAAVFRDYASVWLQVNVAGEDLSPRVQVLASAYAQNAGTVKGVVNVDANGRVGVGTTSPAADMHIADDGNPTLILDDTLSTNQTRIQFAYAGTEEWSAGVQGGDSKKFKISSSDDLSVDTRLTIQTDGNVGIGTSSPGYLLDVAGDLRTTGLIRDSAGDGGSAGQILSSTGAGNDWIYPSAISDGDWTLSENDLYSAVSGNIGVGTASPVYKLDVDGDLRITGRLRNYASMGGMSGQILSATVSGFEWIDPEEILDGDWIASGDDLYDAYPGRVGIGTDSPSYKLHVQGDFLAQTYGSLTLDQEQASTSFVDNYSVLMQSFTAGLSGELRSVSIYLRSPSSGDAGIMPIIFRLYEGDGMSGTILSSRDSTLSGGWDWYTFKFDPPVTVSAGSTYTVYINPSMRIRDWIALESGNPYPGGRFYIIDDYDTVFRTYIGGTLSPALVATDLDRVGIGTANPITNLHLYSLTADDGVTLQVSNNTFSQGLMFQNSLGAYTWRIYRKNVGSNDADLVFANGTTTDLSAMTDVVTFEHGGQVGIGTSDPSAKLEIAGQIKITGGSPGAGKVLTSDANGLATWQTPARSSECVSSGNSSEVLEKERPSAASEESPAYEKAQIETVPNPKLEADYPVMEWVQEGDVLVMNPANGAELYPCSLDTDPMVVGVASVHGENNILTVISGITMVKADATMEPIYRGDLLVSSSIPGHAMKASRPFKFGTIIGKALEPLDSGTGMIKVLVMVR